MALVGGLVGTGRLNDATIDRLQNYYGMAIRNNTGDLVKMKKAVAAVLCHVCATPDKTFYAVGAVIKPTKLTAHQHTNQDLDFQKMFFFI